ncbi:hypothetical protein ARZXY2_4971 (plasmid) [Arthrobacter sp. ZXY-2]|nr:hypothetical protein ARZXY2_4971 [Arthrobacter sp. ZXY-2]
MNPFSARHAMNLLPAIIASWQFPLIVAASLACVATMVFVVLLHRPANRNAVRLLRAWNELSRK